MKTRLGHPSKLPLGSAAHGRSARVPVGAVLRIAVLALAGVAGSVWGLVRYYEHRRAPLAPSELREIPAPDVEPAP